MVTMGLDLIIPKYHPNSANFEEDNFLDEEIMVEVEISSSLVLVKTDWGKREHDFDNWSWCGRIFGDPIECRWLRHRLCMEAFLVKAAAMFDGSFILLKSNVIA